MYGYIYKTVNLVNGKIYIGQKKSKKFLGNKYLGSGRKLHCAISHYGEENFKVYLIEEVENQEDMDPREIYWIKYYGSTNPEKGYNLSLGGNTRRDLVGIHNGFYGKKHSDETRRINSEKHKGKTPWNKGLTKESDDRVRQYSKSLKNTLNQKGAKNKNSTWINKSGICYMINKDDLSSYLLQGYSVGRIFKRCKEERTEILRKAMLGRKRIFKDNLEKNVFKDELQTYLADGWSLGRKPFKDTSNYGKRNKTVKSN